MPCFEPSAFVHGEIIILCTIFSCTEGNTSVLNDSLYLSGAVVFVMLHIPDCAVESLQ